MSEAFDPERHRLAPSRYFEEFHLGETFPLPSRTVTEAQFLAFQAVSGDNHPIHYDREYCRRHGHPELLAHGYQVLVQTAAGAGQFPFLVEESLIAFIEQSSRFLAPSVTTPHESGVMRPSATRSAQPSLSDGREDSRARQC